MINSRQTRLLIIDDDEDDFFIISDYIKDIDGGHFVTEWCNDYEQAIKKITAREYDLYFVDYRLGYHTGLELLQQINKQQKPAEPIVLLTGKGNKDIDIKAMECGATDYLVKSDLNTEKLERCIRYSLDRSANLKELKTREIKYRSLFETSRDAIFIADEDLMFSEVNHAASLLFATAADKLVSSSLYDFIKKDFQKEKIEELLLEKNKIRNLEIEIKSGKKELKPCLLSLSLFENEAGEKMVHGILHDITHIKKAEMANVHAQKLAANERLLQILAHEIRNPLNNISLSIEQLLMQTDDDDERMDLIAIMDRNSKRINNIINELLDQTKPFEMNFQKHTLQEILDESISMTADRINLQHINLEKKFPSKPMEITADKSKLILAFNNILVNAIEAIENGDGELSVGLTSTAENYFVSITDNGKGIPEEYIGKLFEPFFTLKQKGMGLGLAATYSIIQSHQGSIQVNSQLNKGTTFIVGFSRNN